MIQEGRRTMVRLIRNRGTVAAAVLLAGLSFAKEGPAGERYQDLRSKVAFLASDEMEGRLTGSAAIRAAGEFIGETFEAAGLEPIPGMDGFFQPFPFVGHNCNDRRS